MEFRELDNYRDRLKGPDGLVPFDGMALRYSKNILLTDEDTKRYAADMMTASDCICCMVICFPGRFVFNGGELDMFFEYLYLGSGSMDSFAYEIKRRFGTYNFNYYQLNKKV